MANRFVKKDAVASGMTRNSNPYMCSNNCTAIFERAVTEDESVTSECLEPLPVLLEYKVTTVNMFRSGRQPTICSNSPCAAMIMLSTKTNPKSPIFKGRTLLTRDSATSFKQGIPAFVNTVRRNFAAWGLVRKDKLTRLSCQQTLFATAVATTTALSEFPLLGARAAAPFISPSRPPAAGVRDQCKLRLEPVHIPRSCSSSFNT